MAQLEDMAKRAKNAKLAKEAYKNAFKVTQSPRWPILPKWPK